MNVQSSQNYESWERVYRTFESAQFPWFSPKPSPILTSLLQKLPVKNGSTLDLGCGTGETSRFLSSCGFSVTAIDVSQTAVARARRLTGNASQISYVVGNTLTFRSGRRFDLVVDWLHLHDISTDHDALYRRMLADACHDSSCIILCTLVDDVALAGRHSSRRSKFFDGIVTHRGLRHLASIVPPGFSVHRHQHFLIGSSDDQYKAIAASFSKGRLKKS